MSPRTLRFAGFYVRASSVALIAAVVVAILAYWIPRQDLIPIGLDWRGYRAGVHRWLETGMPYEAFELAGPFTPVHLDFIHPPSFLPLALPFALLPEPIDYLLWVGIPLLLLAWVIVPLPAWAWAVAALLFVTDSLLYPILNGNSSLWIAAAFAWSVRVGWSAGLIALKPSLLPLAILGIKAPRRAFALAVVPVLVTLPLWPSYLTVLRNASLPWWYSVTQYSLVALAALPVVAAAIPWIARRMGRSGMGAPAISPMSAAAAVVAVQAATEPAPAHGLHVYPDPAHGSLEHGAPERGSPERGTPKR